MLQSLRQGLQNLRWSGRFVTRDRAGLFPLRFFAQMQMGTHLLLLTIPLTVAPLAASFAWREKNKNKNKTLLSSENASFTGDNRSGFSAASPGKEKEHEKRRASFASAAPAAPHRTALLLRARSAISRQGLLGDRCCCGMRSGRAALSRGCSPRLAGARLSAEGLGLQGEKKICFLGPFFALI